MKNKPIFLIIIAIVLVALLALGVFYKMSFRPIDGLKLTEDKLITNQTLMDLIIINHTSPLGNNLTTILLDKEARTLMDGPQKIGYYVCTENEHSGWILFHDKYSKSKPSLYGPYGWCYV